MAKYPPAMRRGTRIETETKRAIAAERKTRKEACRKARRKAADPRGERRAGKETMRQALSSPSRSQMDFVAAPPLSV
jgi:hypothetical protein